MKSSHTDENKSNFAMHRTYPGMIRRDEPACRTYKSVRNPETVSHFISDDFDFHKRRAQPYH